MTKGQSIIPWQELAEAEGYGNPETMLRHRYLVEFWSLSRLEKRLGVSLNTIKLKAVSYSIKMRSRGGANNPNGRTGKGVDSVSSIGLRGV